MKAMITGVTGFAGSYLAEYLLTIPGVEVVGLKRWNSPLQDIQKFQAKIKV